MFYFDNIKGKKILKSSVLIEFEPNFQHFFTTKESFIKTNDTKLVSAANSNLEMVLNHIGANRENFFKIKQTHSTNIVICPEKPALNKENKGTGKSKPLEIFNDTDGIILHKANTATVLHFADCTPVLLYDPKNHTAAGLHAGWRGTAGVISRKGVSLMKKEFNSNPKDIIAVIGPCIGQEDFESGMEVYEALKNTVQNQEGLFKFKETPEERLTGSLPVISDSAKSFPDLAKINAVQLMEEGVKTVDICHFKTYRNNDILFSYRRENKTTNRISMVLKLG